MAENRSSSDALATDKGGWPTQPFKKNFPSQEELDRLIDLYPYADLDRPPWDMIRLELYLAGAPLSFIEQATPLDIFDVIAYFRIETGQLAASQYGSQLSDQTTDEHPASAALANDQGHGESENSSVDLGLFARDECEDLWAYEWALHPLQTVKPTNYELNVIRDLYPDAGVRTPPWQTIRRELCEAGIFRWDTVHQATCKQLVAALVRLKVQKKNEREKEKAAKKKRAEERRQRTLEGR